LRGVIDPQQDGNERSRGPVAAWHVAGTDVEADGVFAGHEKDGSKQETKEEDAVSKRKVLRCDLRVPRLKIK